MWHIRKDKVQTVTYYRESKGKRFATNQIQYKGVISPVGTPKILPAMMPSTRSPYNAEKKPKTATNAARAPRKV